MRRKTKMKKKETTPDNMSFPGTEMERPGTASPASGGADVDMDGLKARPFGLEFFALVNKDGFFGF